MGSPQGIWSTTHPKPYRQPKDSSGQCSEATSDPQALLRFYRQEGKLVARDLDHRSLEYWNELSAEAACQAMREYANQPKKSLGKPPAYFMQLMQAVQTATHKAKVSRQDVGQVLLRSLAPVTQRLLQQLHDRGKIADNELDTLCYTRLAALAPELQTEVLKVYVSAKSSSKSRSNMAFFQQLLKTMSAKTQQPAPCPPKLTQTTMSNALPPGLFLSANPSTNTNNRQSAADAHDSEPHHSAQHACADATEANMGLPQQSQARAAGAHLATGTATEQAVECMHQPLSATAQPSTQALSVSSQDDPSSEDIWQALLRSMEGPPEAALTASANAGLAASSSNLSSSSAYLPSSDNLAAATAGESAPEGSIVQPAPSQSSLSVFASAKAPLSTPIPAEQTPSTCFQENNLLSAPTATGAGQAPSASGLSGPKPLVADQHSGLPAHTVAALSQQDSPHSAHLLHSAQVPHSIQAFNSAQTAHSAQTQNTHASALSVGPASSAEGALPLSLPRGQPIDMRDLSMQLDPGCRAYNDELCKCWRVLTTQDKLRWRIMLNKKKNRCRLSTLSQSRQQLAEQLHPYSKTHDDSVAARWKRFHSSLKDRLLLAVDSSGQAVDVPSSWYSRYPDEYQIQQSDFPALPCSGTQAACAVQQHKLSASNMSDVRSLRAAQTQESPAWENFNLEAAKAAQQTPTLPLTGTAVQTDKAGQRSGTITASSAGMQIPDSQTAALPQVMVAELQAARATQQLGSAMSTSEIRSEVPVLTAADIQAARAAQHSEMPLSASHSAQIPSLTTADVQAARTFQPSHVPVLTAADLKAARMANLSNATLPAYSSVPAMSHADAASSVHQTEVTLDSNATDLAHTAAVTTATEMRATASPYADTQAVQPAVKNAASSQNGIQTMAAFLPPKPQPKVNTKKFPLDEASSSRLIGNTPATVFRPGVSTQTPSKPMPLSMQTTTAGGQKPAAAANQNPEASPGRYVIPDRRKAYSRAVSQTAPAYMPLEAATTSTAVSGMAVPTDRHSEQHGSAVGWQE